jgi:urease accessory protein
MVMAMNMDANTGTIITMNEMLPLYHAFDALFPIGAYTLSGGMETYTQKGIVRDRETLSSFLHAQIYLLPFGDLGLAAKAAQGTDFVLLDQLCAAMKQPYEIRTGSEKMCSRFLKIQAELANYPSLSAYRTAIAQGHCDGHYPVAVGLLVRDTGAPLGAALELYAYSILSLTVNHAVKLIPLGQPDGQAALFDSLRLIPSAVQKALAASVEDLGVSACGFDMRAIQHETLKGRLYSS